MKKFLFILGIIILSNISTVLSRNVSLYDSVSTEEILMRQLLTDSSILVPSHVGPNVAHSAGNIDIFSGVSSSGAKTYEIPITVPSGMNGFSPMLSLVYNSQRGNSVLGVGWAISGLSAISRSNKNIYYDGEAKGIVMSTDDAFVLDGTRLILLSSTNSYNIYETEQGNIKAYAYTSGDVVKYFEVFYPDGNKGVFGNTLSTDNSLCYPLTSLTDIHGNRIDYLYTSTDNYYNISKISYNGTSVEFKYAQSRTDPLLLYSGGQKIYESKLMSSIVCRIGSVTLGEYTFKYSAKNNKTFLTQVGYKAETKTLNPISFYYGSGQDDIKFTVDLGFSMSPYYQISGNGGAKIVSGVFGYDGDVEGIAIYPGKNPYWKYHRDSGLFQHSQNRFDNFYGESEKILLYSGFHDTFVNSTLVTGEGFIDLITADLEGCQKEYLVRINNLVVDDNDRVTFNVYRTESLTKPLIKYQNTFSFPTVYKDADGGKSVQPKFYYTGDFNGDGKAEIMAVSAHQPFGDTSKPSKCYIFDLPNNKILYQDHIFPFSVDFVGTQQTDAQKAANNTDKLLIIDYDGDGKSDICHINNNGINIYTFDVVGDIYKPRKVATHVVLTKSGLANRDILPADFNGDGLTDLLVSPSSEADGDVYWSVYNSKGDGMFMKSTFRGPVKSRSDYSGFFVHDIDGDDIADLIKYESNSATVYLVKNNKLEDVGLVLNYNSASVFMPVKSSYGCLARLIKISDDNISLFRMSRDDTKESMLTEVVNSLGAIYKNSYNFIGESDSYKKGKDAIFPYVNIGGRIPVVTESIIYSNGQIADYSKYSYVNAVFHRQGLSFCGFGETICRNRGNDFINTYLPYNYGLLKNEWSPMGEKAYTYSVDIQANKIAKIRLKEKVEEDKLKDFTVKSIFTYDTYGYPIREQMSYSDGTEVEKTNSYVSNSVVGDGYNLGYLIDSRVITKRNGLSYEERKYIPSYGLRLPKTEIFYKNGNQVRRHDNEYDCHGNTVSKSLKLYNSQNTQISRYIYDSFGRVTKATDPKGLVSEFYYDTYGRLAKEKDSRGGITVHEYDVFGRETCTTYPDQTHATVTYSWASSQGDVVYDVVQTATGQPEITLGYDALNREVRRSEKRFDGTVVKVDKTYYDIKGNISTVTTPYTGEVPSCWDEYIYDSYGRLGLAYSNARDMETFYVYEDNTITVIEDNNSVTKSYDPFGNLVSVTDSTGTVIYNLAPDGQPESVTVPGDITVSFGYDKYRRRISLTDPSFGTVIYKYDESGNLASETDANGQTTNFRYDSYNRLIKKEAPEFTTDYAYNANDELTSVTTSNGASKTFIYDAYGRMSAFRESVVEGKWLQKDYTYSDGNVSSIKYTSQSGVLATENYAYLNGYLSEVKLNNEELLFKLNSEDVLGHPTNIKTGTITRKYGFTDRGLPSGISAYRDLKIYQNISYSFNPKNSSPESRIDSVSCTNEGFTYDNLNRLKSSNVALYVNAGPSLRDSLIDAGPIIMNPLSGQFSTSGGLVGATPFLPGLETSLKNKRTVSYDIKGNITNKGDVGTFRYDIPSKPYSVSGVTLSVDDVSIGNQSISYCSFSRPSTIIENDCVAHFTYNGDYDRVKMELSCNDTTVLTRYYLGGCYEIDETRSAVKEKLYLCGGYYDAVAAYVKENSDQDGVYYILRDYQGSITQVVSPSGSIVQDIRYDAWGRMCSKLCNPYSYGKEPDLFLGRGYTGHEHLVQFGLINMNARLYDPVLGRFLSPDPFVQMPGMPQNFNRYSYAMNNPMCYVDESGEIAWFFVGAVIGGVANFTYKAISGDINSWSDGFTAFGIGAAAGAVGGVFSSYVFAAAGGAAAGAGGFFAGAVSGAAGSAASMPIESIGNHMAFGDPLMSWGEYGIGVVGGAIVGGTINGAQAAYYKKSFWNGSSHSLPNEPLVLPGEQTIHFDNNLKLSEETGPYTVYQGVDRENGTVRYIGITGREPEVRYKEHLNSGTNRAKLRFDEIRRGYTHSDARILEQYYINRFGMIKDGGILFNLRNEISPKYWKRFGIDPFKASSPTVYKGSK